MYHRVASEPHDPWNLCVNPDRFAEQMEVIARFDARIDLAALARADGYDRQGRRLAVTFDDGYIDNIIRALPVMEQFEIPATFFVVAGALGRNREFWWDGLERAILWAGSLPDTLAIDLSGRPFAKFEGEIPGERVGEFPVEMVPHAFRSLAESMKAAIHVRVEGENAHHMVEGSFKAFGRALRQAVRIESERLPSTTEFLE